MKCATTTIKNVVIFLNFVCVVLGIGSIVANVLMLKALSVETKTICIFLIILGGIIFAIAFFGCCGAIQENICFLWTYALFLVVLIVANLIILCGFIKDIDGTKHAHNHIENAWQQQLHGDDQQMTTFQHELHCCGKADSDDYTKANLTVPESCYKHNEIEAVNLYVRGCLKPLTMLYEADELRVRGFTWATFAVESFACVCAVVLAIRLHNDERRLNY